MHTNQVGMYSFYYWHYFVTVIFSSSSSSFLTSFPIPYTINSHISPNQRWKLPISQLTPKLVPTKHHFSNFCVFVFVSMCLCVCSGEQINIILWFGQNLHLSFCRLILKLLRVSRNRFARMEVNVTRNYSIVNFGLRRF